MPFFPVQWSLLTVLLFLAHLCVADSSTVVRVRRPNSLVAIPDAIPSCALSCMEEFVGSEYRTTGCYGLSDVNCLCRANTPSGFTLGEAAYRCAFSHCPDEVISSSNVYGICNPVAGALPMTHSIITVTNSSVVIATASETSTRIPPSPSWISYPVSTGSPSASPTASSTAALTGSRSILTTFSTTTSTTPATKTTSSSADGDLPILESATSVSSGGRTHSLSSGAVIGISVTSGISACFVMGIAIFFCCRRRVQNRISKDPDFFEIGGLMSEPSDFAQSPTGHPTPVHTQSSASAANTHEGASNSTTPFQPRTRNPFILVTRPTVNRLDGMKETGHIGLPTPHGFEAEDSPRSLSSQRTVSKLLPDKPTDVLCPKPLGVSRQGDFRPISGGTLFEEDIQRRSRSIRALPTNGYTGFSGRTGTDVRNRPYDRAPVVGLPANPRAMRYGWEAVQMPAMPSPSQQAKPVDLGSGGRVPVQPSREATGTRNNQEKPLPPLPVPDEIPGYGYGRDTGPDAGFGTIDIDEGHRSRHHHDSRSNAEFPKKRLSPVREVATPGPGVRGINNRDHLNHCSPVRYPKVPGPASIRPVGDTTTRPRLVGRDDIKRVQIRRRPKETTGPYSPDDLWMLQATSSSEPTSQDIGKQTPPSRHDHYPSSNPTPGVLDGSRLANRQNDTIDTHGKTERTVPVPKGPRNYMARRQSPLEHNLTPSRRGADLILRVD